jgi:hypothetical protein
VINVFELLDWVNIVYGTKDPVEFFSKSEINEAWYLREWGVRIRPLLRSFGGNPYFVDI